MINKPISTQDELIQYLLQSKKEMIEEIKNSYQRPEIQEALLQLRANRLKTNGI